MLPLPTARQELTVVAGPDGRIYAIGGQARWGQVNTVEAYDTAPTRAAWVEVAPMTMDRYYAQGAVGLDGHIYMIGGYTSQNGGNDGTMEAYGPNFSVAPTSGMPGDSITFSGSNFAANSTVSVYWGTVATGTELFTASADGSGNVGQTTFQVPAGADEGAYQITDRIA